MTADQTIAALRDAHEDLVAHLKGLDDAALAARSGASEWSVAQVLSHLGSGAEITEAVLRSARDGRPAPGPEDHQAVWDRWDALGVREQADGFVTFHGSLVNAFEELDADARQNLRITLSFLPMPIDVTQMSAMRLFEIANHSWDVRVASDPGAVLSGPASELLTDLLCGPVGFLFHLLAKPDAWSGREATIRVETGDPEPVLGLVIADRVSLTATAPEAADSTLALTPEALVRLFTGRLAGERVPAGTATTGAVTLDDLRTLFPGV
ncbi:hypothetical protein AQ490_18705 [Wenjunlia vitaminophila]|uniref:Mycothiol-dependent maleylpyruvate isomerase metal-binding domain-containing protein n=1 Tax=Wenjunlia vitaminophila TaxID=76728 RepID=A0A0T6LU74_WENVI|nr:maleylpyruvate isomerase N-terminal domain-containing protein [Wenjunlia vitaminophila]KRV49735.1 hypothetical protein AQ490_18705 [Wenjunlia vitaminophila]